MLSDVSFEPFELSLIKEFCEPPGNDVKLPPTNIFPSDWGAIVLTTLLNPVPMLNDESFEPFELSLIK